MKKILIVLAAMALAFLAGYLPEHLKLEALEKQSQEAHGHLESQLANVEANYSVARIHGQLGMLILETEQQNFASAQKRSSELFDAVGEAIPATTDAASRTVLSNLSKQRDVITSALATASPEAAIRLKGLYAELGKAIRVG